MDIDSVLIEKITKRNAKKLSKAIEKGYSDQTVFEDIESKRFFKLVY